MRQSTSTLALQPCAIGPERLPRFAECPVPIRPGGLNAELLDEQSEHILQRDPPRRKVRRCELRLENVLANRELETGRAVAPHRAVTDVKMRVCDAFYLGMPVIGEYFPPIAIVQAMLVCRGLDLPWTTVGVPDDPVRVENRKSESGLAAGESRFERDRRAVTECQAVRHGSGLITTGAKGDNSIRDAGDGSLKPLLERVDRGWRSSSGQLARASLRAALPGGPRP